MTGFFFFLFFFPFFFQLPNNAAEACVPLHLQSAPRLASTRAEQQLAGDWECIHLSLRACTCQVFIPLPLCCSRLVDWSLLLFSASLTHPHPSLTRPPSPPPSPPHSFVLLLTSPPPPSSCNMQHRLKWPTSPSHVPSTASPRSHRHVLALAPRTATTPRPANCDAAQPSPAQSRQVKSTANPFGGF